MAVGVAFVAAFTTAGAGTRGADASNRLRMIIRAGLWSAGHDPKKAAGVPYRRVSKYLTRIVEMVSLALDLQYFFSGFGPA